MDGFERFLTEDEAAVVAPELAELQRLLATTNEAGEAYEAERRAFAEQNRRLMRIGAMVCGFDDSLMLDVDRMAIKLRPVEEGDDGGDTG